MGWARWASWGAAGAAVVAAAACSGSAAAPTDPVAAAATPSRASAVPLALAGLAAAWGVPAETRSLPTGVLGWDQGPADAELEGLYRGGELLAVLHPRRGTWRLETSRPAPPRPSPLRFAGVSADALVWVAADREVPAPLLHPASVKAPSPVALDYRDDFAGLPQQYAGGVAEWGPFAEAVPDQAVQALLAAPGVTTAIVRSVSAAADGPRQLWIAHRR